MFAAAQQKAPNATPHHLSSKIRAQKNRVTDYLASLSVKNKEKVIKLAISYAREHRVQKRKEKSEILEEISKRIAQNKQKKNMTDFNRIEGILTKLESTAELPSKFPELDICKIEELTQLLEGRCIGKNIIHSWYDEETWKESLLWQV